MILALVFVGCNHSDEPSGPHLMFMPKDPTTIDGHTTNFNTGAPYIMWAGSPYRHLMIPVNGYYQYQPKQWWKRVINLIYLWGEACLAPQVNQINYSLPSLLGLILIITINRYHQMPIRGPCPHDIGSTCIKIGSMSVYSRWIFRHEHEMRPGRLITMITSHKNQCQYHELFFLYLEWL